MPSEYRERIPTHRILPFVLRSPETTDRLPEITLSTHATADQVYGIVELARRWEGPLSLAVFAPGLDAGLAVAQLDRACRCEPAMYKVSTNFLAVIAAGPNIEHAMLSFVRSHKFYSLRLLHTLYTSVKKRANAIRFQGVSP